MLSNKSFSGRILDAYILNIDENAENVTCYEIFLQNLASNCSVFYISKSLNIMQNATALHSWSVDEKQTPQSNLKSEVQTDVAFEWTATG